MTGENQNVNEMLRLQNYTSGWDLLSDICRYFYSERDFYANALQVEGQNSFRDFFAESIGVILPMIMRDQFRSMEDPHYFVEFFTDAFQAAILRWLKSTPLLPPEQFMSRLESIMEVLQKR